jgi:hypothetical protein
MREADIIVWLVIGFVLWLIGAALTAHVANIKGRSGVAWFFLTLVVSPLLALIALAVLPAKSEQSEAELLAEILDELRALRPESRVDRLLSRRRRSDRERGLASHHRPGAMSSAR